LTFICDQNFLVFTWTAPPFITDGAAGTVSRYVPVRQAKKFTARYWADDRSTLMVMAFEELSGTTVTCGDNQGRKEDTAKVEVLGTLTQLFTLSQYAIM